MSAYVPIAGGPAPSDLPSGGAITPPVKDPGTVPAPRPMTSLLAAATRLTNESLRDRRGAKRASAESWQEDAWEMYDLVGEMRFLSQLLASQQSKARFYVGTLAGDPRDPPEPSEDAVLRDALEAIGDGPTGLSQLIKRLSVNLYVPGDGWLVGIPKGLMPGARSASGADLPLIPLSSISLDDLEWRMLSVSEIKFDAEQVSLLLGDDPTDEVKTDADGVYLIRVWNPHPRRWWQADSATRSNLPVLRELVGLTMHISAQIDSRLAGAGVLLAPDSAARAAKRAAGLPEDGEEDPFTDALIKAMLTPISDRANASAYVPLVWTVPDESIDKFTYLSFSKDLDAQAKDMRDEAIRRFALGADAPPELLLGVGGMNHWGAWLVQEDVVHAHLEPPLALICDALTTQYLRPIMREIGSWSEADIENHVVWYDVEHLIVRPNRGDDAKSAHDSGVIGDAALRDAYGFSEDDAPKPEDAESIALAMIRATPTLMANPGLPVILDQLRALLGGRPVPLPAGAVVDAGAGTANVESGEGDTPAEAGPPVEVGEPELASVARQLGLAPATLREWMAR